MMDVRLLQKRKRSGKTTIQILCFIVDYNNEIIFFPFTKKTMS